MFSLPFLFEITNYLAVSALDESADCLLCLINAFILAVCAIMIKIEAGTKFTCWIPQTYSRAWEEFAESYCFLKNTYWVSLNDRFSDVSANYKEAHRLNYYQWSCLYLSLAALAFLAPKFIWKKAQALTVIPILYFCETAADIEEKTPEKRKEKIREMAEVLESKLDAFNTKFSIFKIRPIIVYSFIKFLYLSISLVQFLMLGVYLGHNDIFWGVKITRNIYNGITWEENGLFSRMNFCDFTIREMAGNTRDETLQCLLELNEFNEKIFLFLWFWLLFTFIVTAVSHIYIFILFCRNTLAHSVLFHIRIKKDKDQKIELRKFVTDFLGKDGQLVLSYVKSQSDTVAQELACEMLEIYRQRTEAFAALLDTKSPIKDIDNNAKNDTPADMNSDSSK